MTLITLSVVAIVDGVIIIVDGVGGDSIMTVSLLMRTGWMLDVRYHFLKLNVVIKGGFGEWGGVAIQRDSGFSVDGKKLGSFLDRMQIWNVHHRLLKTTVLICF